jgi:hypothetical protein
MIPWDFIFLILGIFLICGVLLFLFIRFVEGAVADWDRHLEAVWNDWLKTQPEGE